MFFTGRALLNKPQRVRRGVKENRDGHGPHHYAVRAERPDDIQTLVDEPVNENDREGHSELG